jgi:hypothetical protein
VPEDEDELEARQSQVLESIQNGDLEQATKLMWRSGGTQDWFAAMAPVLESAGDGYARSDPPRAIWCYERARDLFEADNAGATSGGEGMALLMEVRGSHLGRKIWLLQS